MTKVLHITSSTRGVDSLTTKLGMLIIDKIKANKPTTEVINLDLAQTPFPHLSNDQITAFFTPPEHRTAEQERLIKRSDEAVAELFDVDILVIGAPMYNFSINSSLKAYFDHIARARVTFRYTETGSEGLLENKKAYVVSGSAGLFSVEGMEAQDFSTPYIKKFLGFIGITDVEVIRIEGTAIPGLQETAFQTAINSIEKAFRQIPA